MMMMMMVMMVGSVVCVSGGLSTIVTLVNEKIIEFDALDFLLIAGWGKEKAGDGTGTGDGTTVTGSTYCIDTVIDKCKSAQAFSTLHTVDDHDSCVSTTMAECISNGGSRTSTYGTYPKDCVAGSRIECAGKRGSERGTCSNDYKQKCKDAGGTWSGGSNGGDDNNNNNNNDNNNGGDTNGGGNPTGDTRTAAEICSKYGMTPGRRGCVGGRTKKYGRCMTSEQAAACDADVARILGI